MGMLGFCSDEVKPLGPVHAKVTPVAEVVAVRLSVLPEHSGEFAPKTGVAGAGVTVTLVLAGVLAQPFITAETS